MSALGRALRRGRPEIFNCTTLMLGGGADVRYVRAMLGHSKLETTRIYTQVSIRKLKEVRTMAHPAKMRGSRGGSRGIVVR